MALNAKKALAASKSYTDETVVGGGALKGKNCTVSSIADIPATSEKPAGQRVTFSWTLDDGTEQTGTMDVYNGKDGQDGQGIDRMYVNAEGHLVVVYDNGTEEDVGEITIPDFQADWDEIDPEENSFIKNKPLLGTASGMDIPESGDASNGQVVLGNDSRLTNARNAADVYNWAKAENPPTYTKSDVGLGNVDNTSDANKPVSTAQQTALDAKTDLTNISDVEATTTASKSYAANTYLIYSGVLYKVSTAIAQGGEIVTSGVGKNVDAVKVMNEIGSGGGGTSDYTQLTNKPQINDVTLTGNKSLSDLGFGTAAVKNAPASGDAGNAEVVLGNDSRLTDSRTPTSHQHTLSDITDAGTAAAKDSTNAVTQSSTDLIESGAVYTALSDKANTSDLGTASAKDSTNAVTANSTDLVESGAVKTAIDTAVASAYHHAGTKTVAELLSSLLVAANEGDVYNMTDAGATTADFIEGAGKPIRIGDNVGIAKVGENSYKFDLLSGFVDTSTFIEKSNTAGLVKNDGTIDTTSYVSDISGKADKVQSATNGNFAGLDANGNLTDSGKNSSDLDNKCDLTNIAKVFTTSDTFSVGDWVFYEGLLYRCTTLHQGAWNSSHFSARRVDQLIPDDVLSLYGNRSSISMSGTSPGKSSISAGGYSFSAFEFDTEYTVFGNEYALYNGLRYIDFDVIMGNDVYRNYKYYDASPYEAEYQSLNEPSYPFFFVVIDPEGYPFAIKMYDINLAAGTFKMKISYLNGYYRGAGEIYLAINTFEKA